MQEAVLLRPASPSEPQHKEDCKTGTTVKNKENLDRHMPIMRNEEATLNDLQCLSSVNTPEWGRGGVLKQLATPDCPLETGCFAVTANSTLPALMLMFFSVASSII